MASTVVEQVHQDYHRFKDAQQVLGVSKMTLWRWIRDGKVQAERIGREVLIEKAEVERLRRR